MPTYVYELVSEGPNKGKTVEFEQSIKELPLATVEIEGVEYDVKRIIAGSTNFILKGGCWHRDSYEKGLQSGPKK